MVATKMTRQLSALLLVALSLSVSCAQPPEPSRVAQTVQPSQPAPLVQTTPLVQNVPALQSARSWIDAPLHGSTVLMGAAVQVVSHSTHSEGLSQVELAVDGTVVGSEESPNPKLTLITTRQTWRPNAAGKHTITVRAKNAAGIWGPQASAEVTVKAIEASRGTPLAPQPTGMTVAGSATPTPVATRVPTDTSLPRSVPTDIPTPTDMPTSTPAPVVIPTDTAVPAVRVTDTPVPEIRVTDTPVPRNTPRVVPPIYTPTATKAPILIFTPVPRLPLVPVPTVSRPTLPPIK